MLLLTTTLEYNPADTSEGCLQLMNSHGQIFFWVGVENLNLPSKAYQTPDQIRITGHGQMTYTLDFKKTVTGKKGNVLTWLYGDDGPTQLVVINTPA